jgi:predicted NAD/FAD-binding protein
MAPKKVLVIGSGCAGLGAAWHLKNSGIDVSVYESDSKAGGHANTIYGNVKLIFILIFKLAFNCFVVHYFVSFDITLISNLLKFL